MCSVSETVGGILLKLGIQSLNVTEQINILFVSINNEGFLHDFKLIFQKRRVVQNCARHTKYEYR